MFFVDFFLIFFIKTCCGYSLELHRQVDAIQMGTPTYAFIKTYVVGTHLNCIDKSMQFKWVPTTYAFIKK